MVAPSRRSEVSKVGPICHERAENIKKKRNFFSREAVCHNRDSMRGRSTAVWLAFWLPGSLAIHATAFTWAVHVPAHDAPVENVVAKSAAPTGETFDIDPDNNPVTDQSDDNGDPSAAESGKSEGAGVPKRTTRDHGSPGKTAKSGNEEPEQVFGADGDRSATDLATTFTRAFPQTASADASWASAPMGSNGAVDVVLTIDDDGNLIGSEIRGVATPALHRGVERTLVLLKHRVFTAHARVTTLRVSAVVSPDSVHDGLHGDVFALGGSFSANEGDVFFALAIGRRVDVKITARR